MVFGIFLLCCNLILPVMMIGFGMAFLNQNAKINKYYGYRTRMSMLNQNTWDFAHKCCGRLWKRIGLIMLPVSIIISIPMLWLGETMQGVLTGVLETVQILVMLGSIFLVERELKHRFDEKGNPLQ